jgi:hypothetical protein
MVRFEVSCTLPFSRRDFWRLRATPTFMSYIVRDGLLRTFTSTPATSQPDGSSTRQQSYVPANVDCPAVVRAVVGDTAFGVTDTQRWNDDERLYVQEFTIRPSFLSALSRTEGTLALEVVPAVVEDDEDGDGSGASTEGDGELDEDCGAEQCAHVVRGEVRVSILTVGWFVERAIAHNLRLFYDDYPKTVGRFRRFIVEEYANGDESVPISVVVDRVLAADAKRAAEAAAADEDEDACADVLAKAQMSLAGHVKDRECAASSSVGDSDDESEIASIDYNAVEEDVLC